KEELELTKKFEGMQDRLFKVAQRLHDLKILDEKVKNAEADLAAIDAELAKSPWTPEPMKKLTTKAQRAQEDVKKRDDTPKDLVKEKGRAQQSVPPPPEPCIKDPWFYGGMLGGLVLDGLAFLLKKPFVGLFGLLPFLAALVAILRFIEADEGDKQTAQLFKDL